MVPSVTIEDNLGKVRIESASEKPLKRFRKSGEVFAVTQLKQGVNER
jgi:hypothetical protein